MPSRLNQERVIVEKLIEHLKTITENVQLGYSGTGLEKDIEIPAILVQLSSITEEQRQGAKAKFQIEFHISAVVKTNQDTTYNLIDLSRSIRELFSTGSRFTPEV